MSTNSFQVLQPLQKIVSTQINSPNSDYQSTPVDSLKPNPAVIAIEGLATGTPEHIVKQSEAAQFIAELDNFKKSQTRIRKLYENTCINTRHLAVNPLSQEAVNFSRCPGNIQARMQSFQKIAVPLAERVARQALAAAERNSTAHGEALDSSIKDSINLVVFVSSTGFVAPGVDAALIERLGLRRDTIRVTVNFMGCAAAMNGLRVAADHLRAYPNHKALVVCLELSSINAVFEDDLNDVVIHSLFGDGCAALVIGAGDAASMQQPGKIIIRGHLSYLLEATQDGIILDIRNNGITCTLSRQLPDYIEAGVGQIVESFLNSNQLTKADIDLWAVHPGGPKIIQKAQASLNLSNDQVAVSWFILQHYGNMLSASIIFVLDRMLHNCAVSRSSHPIGRMKPSTGMAFSFSPGVGVEGFLFETI